MIKRYRHLGAVIFIKSGFESETLDSETASTQTWDTVIKGEPGAVVTFVVTAYVFTNGGHNYTVDGVSKSLTDTFTKTLDGTGHVTITQFIDVGTTTPGNAINTTLTITGTTIGPVDPVANQSTLSKTT